MDVCSIIYRLFVDSDTGFTVLNCVSCKIIFLALLSQQSVCFDGYLFTTVYMNEIFRDIDILLKCNDDHNGIQGVNNALSWPIQSLGYHLSLIHI